MASESPINHPPIQVIGTDAAGIGKLSPHMQNLLLEAEVIAGPKRLLEQIPIWWERHTQKKALPKLISSDQVNELLGYLRQKNNHAIILASGDALWFGIGRLLLENFPRDLLEFHPAPSSLQIAFARLGRPWQDATWISLHGRDPSPLAKKLQQHPSALAVLTDPVGGSVEVVRKIIKASGLEDAYSVWLFEQLGHPDERISQIRPNHPLPPDINQLNLLILLRKEPETNLNPNSTLIGLEDGIFLQNKDRPGLMTKREVRVQLLADLELPEEGVLWDIGAGVGSVGLEALRLRPKLKLMAVEKRGGGEAVIKKNAARLNVIPSAIFEQDALALLESSQLPKSLVQPDRVLLGGGGSQRTDLLKAVLKRLKPNAVIVIPLATVEALTELKPLIENSGLIISVTQHQSWRGLPLSDGTRWSPMNPVIILKGKYKQRN